MGRIFLSYAREDIDFARCATRVLESASHSVWWDRHIEGGEEFAKLIEAELDKADVVLVAWSQHSVKSRWVRDEAAVGGDTGRLLPVSIDGSLAPMGFRQFQALDLKGWKGGTRDARTAELINCVERWTKGKPAAGPARVEKEHRQGVAVGRRPLLWGIAAILLLIIAAGEFFLSSRGTLRGPPPKPTIGLLPFSATSSDDELRDITAQTRDSIAHTLAQNGIPVRLLGSAPQDRRSGGDFLISGEVSRSGDKVVATVRLDEAAHGVTVLSRRYEAGASEASILPERVGVRLASYLDGPNLLVLDRRHPVDPAIMAELFVETNDQLQDYQVSKRVAAKAPDNANAQLGVAFFSGFVLSQLPRDERAQAVAEGRRAADRVLALAPDFGDTYATWCLLHSDARMAECEDQLRTGARVDPDAPYLNGFIAGLMRDVGRFDEALELTKLSYTHNPFDFYKIGEMLRGFELAGDADEARDLYAKGVRWWPENRQGFFRNRMWGLLERGDFAGMERVEREVGADALPKDYQKSGPIADALKSKSIPALKRICADAQEFTLMTRCMLALAMIGDPDGAYRIADQLYPRRLGRTAQETERIWLDEPDSSPRELITSPAGAPMRRDPRFLPLAERVGLIAYWRRGRRPDFCRAPRKEPLCSAIFN